MSACSTPAVIDQKILDHILTKLNLLDALDSIKQDIHDLKDIKKAVNDLTKSFEFTQAQVDSLAETHSEVVNDNLKLTEQVQTLNYQNTYLLDKINQLEDYSRRENIRICGVHERDGVKTVGILSTVSWKALVVGM
jgi:predicted nuclease with TOPRIM domain